MAQHFLLSAEARTLSLASIYKGGEDAAYGTFCRMRWAETEGAPVCPRCGGLKHYDVKGRRKFKCAGCTHQFSVTSGTIFAFRKMAFMDLCAAIVLCVNAVKGLSALQLVRDIDCQYKTAWVLAHKLREALASEVEGIQLAGEVEIDGAYFGGKVRPANHVESRKDRRKAENQNGERRVVVVLRERDGATKTFVRESEAEGVALAVDNVAADATVYADEARHWDVLHDRFPTVGRINHSESYSTPEANTNQAESYFSRLRRMVDGQHHHVSARYLYQCEQVPALHGAGDAEIGRGGAVDQGGIEQTDRGHEVEKVRASVGQAVRQARDLGLDLGLLQ